MIAVARIPWFGVYHFDYSVNGISDLHFPEARVCAAEDREITESRVAAERDRAPLAPDQRLDTRVVRWQGTWFRLIFSGGDDPPDSDDALSAPQSSLEASYPPHLSSETAALPPIVSDRRALHIRMALQDAIAHVRRRSPVLSQRPSTTGHAAGVPSYLPAREPDWGP
jgi:hypothetical protein